MQKAMKGLGTDDQALVRIVVSRSECDMVQIKKSFETQFKGSLADWLKVGIFNEPLKFDNNHDIWQFQHPSTLISQQIHDNFFCYYCAAFYNIETGSQILRTPDLNIDIAHFFEFVLHFVSCAKVSVSLNQIIITII